MGAVPERSRRVSDSEESNVVPAPYPGHIGASAKRGRRHNPERRSRLIAATLDVIASSGVAGTSRREVARRADVPLGSMTYHFANMDELLCLAFSQFTSGRIASFDECMRDATSPNEAREAHVQTIYQDFLATDDLGVVYELYAIALRRPAIKKLMQQWIESSRNSL